MTGRDQAQERQNNQASIKEKMTGYRKFYSILEIPVCQLAKFGIASES